MDILTAKKLIMKHTQGHAAVITKAVTAERYYRNKNDILYKKNADEENAENPLRSADNRVPRNFYGLLVNQKASYMFTAPPLFDVGSQESNQVISDTLGDIYAKNCKDLCVKASNTGMAWVHYWVDDKQVFDYGIIDAKEIIPIWDSHLNKKLLAVLRVYKNIDDEGKTWNIYEYWTDTECWSFQKLDDDTIDCELIPYSMFMNFADAGSGTAPNQLKHDFGKIPFIPFPNNNICTGDLDNIKALVDTYDKVYSGFANDLEDIQEIIFLLTNYNGANLNEFLADIKKYKTVKLQSIGADDHSGLETLTIDIPVEAREKLLDMTRKAIFEQGQGVDPQPQDFGNASGVALKYLYSLLELKAGLMETEFRLGFGMLIRAICDLKGIKIKTLTQTWTRTAIANDLELATICKDSVGIISNKTILKNHPFVENADEEEKRLAKEKEQLAAESDSYKAAFNKEGAANGNS
ncbi:phage portal protein [Pectinatus frisingensis]|uniref:phage portal protein n=1 Tax=Pectinatus frisingensis TaxID=865 RepID=UPI0015F55168|nr:phage portal protein [Pectinatus frisingensis]